LINDVPDRPGDRRTAGRRAPAGLVAALVVTAILAAGAVAGCGGGDDTTTAEPTTGGGPTTTGTSSTSTTGGGETTGGETENGRTIRDVVIAVLASGDPDRACSPDYVTDAYITAAYGDKQGCVQAQTKASAAKELPIESTEIVKLKPPTAAAEVDPRGGQYDGEHLTITLVKEGQVWKIDSLKSDAPVGP
jgi:hypothetical protein